MSLLLLGPSGPPPATEPGLPSPYNFAFDYIGTDDVAGPEMRLAQALIDNAALASPSASIPKQWEEPGSMGGAPTIVYTPPAALPDSNFNAAQAPFDWLDQPWIFGDQLTGSGPGGFAYDNSATSKAFAVLTSIDFGFVAVGVSKSILLFNAFDEAKNITAVTTTGLTGVSTDLTIPFLLKAGASKAVLVSIAAQGDISLVGQIVFVISDSPDPNIDITGTRAIVFPYEPNWADPPEVDLIVAAEVYQSSNRFEQRSTTIQEGEFDIEFNATYGFEDANDRKRLFNRFIDIRSRPALVGFPTERLLSGVDATGLTSITITNLSFSTELLFTSLLVMRLDTRDRHFYEIRKASSINVGANQITVNGAWTASIPPAFQVFYFALPVNLNSLERTNKTDEVHELRANWVGLPV